MEKLQRRKIQQNLRADRKITYMRSEQRSSSYQDVDDNYAMIDVVVSTGAPVYREEYDENGQLIPIMRSLEISEEAIRMGRLLHGCPVLDNHTDGRDGDSVQRVLGCVDKAWIEKDGVEDRLMATLKISKLSEEERQIADKIKSGIITGVSVGAEIHQQEARSCDDDGILHVVATDWEPHEVSIVLVPADGKAIIRSKNHKRKEMSMYRDAKTQKAYAEKLLKVLTDLDADESDVQELTKVLERRKKATRKLKEKRVEAPVEEEEEEETEEVAVEEEVAIEEEVPADTERMPDKIKRLVEEAEAPAEEEEEEEEVSAEDEKALEDAAELAEEVDGASEDVGALAEEVAADIAETLPLEVTPEQESVLIETIEGVVDDISAELLEEEVPQMEQLAKELRNRLKSKLYTRRSSEDIGGKTKNRVRAAHDPSHEARRMKRADKFISESLASRITKGLYEQHHKIDMNANPFNRMSMQELAQEFLHSRGVENAHRIKKEKLYWRVLGNRYERRGGSAAGPIGVTSDFSSLLSNVVSKSVLASYETLRGEQTFDSFVRRETVDDFKEQERPSLGQAGKLLETPPGADAQMFAMSEEQEKYSIKSYSRVFQLTRQAFVNDDTGQLQMVVTSGHSAADLESDLVYEQLVNGRVGGAALYGSRTTAFGLAQTNTSNHATNFPLTGTGATAYGGIVELYKRLSTRRGHDVDSPINLQFGTLLVPVALHFEANQTLQVQYPAEPQYPNPYASMYNIIAEPRLDAGVGAQTAADGAKTYYGLAKNINSFRPFIELGTLSGQPITKFEETFMNDVLQWKLTHDVGAKVLDWRLIHRIQMK